MSTSPTRSGNVSIDGTRYSYEETGRGHPLVLLHSGLSDLRMWDGQVPVLAERYRVIAYDLPGFGRSETPKGEFSARADLAGLLRARGVERAHVVGLSRGGGLAIDFAIEYPAVVSALVATAAGLGGRPPSPFLREAIRVIDEAEEARDWDRQNELELRLWVDGPGQPTARVAPEMRAFVGRTNRENLLRAPGDAKAVPLTPPAIDRLAEIRAPTLVVVGDLDVPDTRIVADTLEARVAGARKVVLPGVAHLVNLERPDEFNRIVLDFLASVEHERSVRDARPPAPRFRVPR